MLCSGGDFFVKLTNYLLLIAYRGGTGSGLLLVTGQL